MPVYLLTFEVFWGSLILGASILVSTRLLQNL